jgi:formylglycine-generating enzyme required for sulfatase activity
MTPNRLKVFLCHSSADKTIVRELYDRLLTEGWIDPWLDEKKLLPGQDWDMAIEKAVEESHAVIVCVSNSSVTKEGYIQKELRFVLDIALTKPEEEIFVIPLRLANCQPPRRLRAFHYVDYFPKAQQDNTFNMVLESLKVRAGTVGVKVGRDSIPTTPAEPKSISPEPENKPVSEMPTKEWIDKNKLVLSNDMEFMRIPAGKFIMGSNNGGDNEKPQHTVDIPYDYWMGRYPVTNMHYYEFRKILWDRGGANHPVVDVSWNDAMEYCQWLNETFKSELAGLVRAKHAPSLQLRLPIEAEWEKASRGTDGRKYPWGNTIDNNKCNSRESGKGETTPVGLYSLHGDSPYGCADMSGNVWEWTHSEYKPYLYNTNGGHEDESKVVGDVVRGGAYVSGSGLLRCSCRFRLNPNYGWDYLGFRLVIAPPITDIISGKFA